MNITTTVDLTGEEVLIAVTTYVKDKLSWRMRPDGEALNFVVHDFGLRVEWGEKPAPPEDTVVPITTVTETTTKPEPVCQ